MALRPNYISLFAGVGGLELAVRLALPDARCVCYVEREVEAAEILAARIADKTLDDAPIWSDVSTFDGKPWRGLVDGLVGGFPCQDLSVAGKREGIKRGNRSGLFYEYARIIREVEPRWVYIENVPAVLAFPAGGIVLGELAALGFDAEWGSLRASDVGASHQRHRKFILAYREGAFGVTETYEADAASAGGGRWNGLRGSGYPLAYATGERCGEEGRVRCGENSLPGGAGADVGNSTMCRRDDTRFASGQYRQQQQVGGSGSELAITSGDGRQAGISGSITGNEGHAGIAYHHSNAMVFAPGPGAAIWNDVLVRDYGMRPALSQAEAESCLRRVADGLASPLDQRIDRLRGCGNGVVALQGAAALRELMRRVERL